MLNGRSQESGARRGRRHYIGVWAYPRDEPRLSNRNRKIADATLPSSLFPLPSSLLAFLALLASDDPDVIEARLETASPHRDQSDAGIASQCMGPGCASHPVLASLSTMPSIIFAAIS
jgi:hypothetical protein